MKLTWVLCLIASFSVKSSFSSIAFNAQDPNKAFLVSVSHGLPGLNFDIDMMKGILTHNSNQFQTVIATDIVVNSASAGLEKVAGTSGTNGSFAFYFTGHGMKGGLYLQDRIMTIEEIREAIEKGRQQFGALNRLVMVFDSCQSGSLLDPLDSQRLSQDFADNVLRVMTAPSKNGRSYASYWKELVIFASAGADETCLAGETGSMFTLAFKKAWDSVMQSDGTIAEFIAQTKASTVGSHPIERLVPASLAQSKLGRP